MKLYRIEDMIIEHKLGHISISSIGNRNGILIDNIVDEGELVYDNFMVKYTNPEGETFSITDTNAIDVVNYKNNKNVNPDFNEGVTGDIQSLNVAPQPLIYNKKSDYIEPEYYNGLISESYLDNGMIKPGLSKSGNYIYDAHLGNTYRHEYSSNDGAFKKTSEYPNYIGDGYVTVEDGTLEMIIDVPITGRYKLSVLAGNHYATSTLSEVMVNRVARFIRTSTNTQFLWQESPLERYSYEKDDYEIDSEIVLYEGKNTIKFKYDEKFSTKNNDIDAVVLDHISDTDDENGNDIITNYEEGNRYNDKTIFSLERGYIDNTLERPHSGIRKREVKVDQNIYTPEDLDFFSNSFIKVESLLKYNLEVPEEGDYKFSLTGASLSSEKDQIGLFVVDINDKTYHAKVDYKEKDKVVLSLYNYHSNNVIYEKIDHIKLKKRNHIVIRNRSDNNPIYLDSIIIDKDLKEYRSDLFATSILLPNINNLYILNENYRYTNEAMDKFSKFNRSFNNVKEYIGNTFIYKVYDVDYHEEYTETLIRYVNTESETDIQVEVKDFYDPKILLINESIKMLNDNGNNYLLFRPFIFKTFSYEHTDTKGTRILKKDKQLVPLDELTTENIPDIRFRIPDDFSELISNITSLGPLDLIKLVKRLDN